MGHDLEFGRLFNEIHPQRGARLYELVAKQIEDLILSGRLSSGDRLPSESELGRQFSVSRTVIREAVKVLADKGLVRPEPGRGTFVRKPDPELLAASMDTILRVEQCSLADLLELRRMIEVPAAGLAAARADSEHRAAIEAAFIELEQQLHSGSKFMLADKAFHVAIARATGNELTAAVVGALMALCWKLQLVPVQYYPNSMPHHRAIKDAVLAGDQEGAESAMSAHHDQIWGDLVAVGAMLEPAEDARGD